MQMPMNGGYPPNNSPGGLRFNHPPPPHNNGPAFNTGGGPRMMGPPPGQGRGDNGNYWGDDSMRGGPPRGGHFHRGGRGRGAEPGFRGRGRGGPRGGHNNMNGVWGLRVTCFSQIIKNIKCRIKEHLYIWPVNRATHTSVQYSVYTLPWKINTHCTHLHVGLQPHVLTY